MSKFCSNCGAQIDDNAVFCGSCGTAQAMESQTDDNSGSTAAKKGSKALPLIIAAVAVIIIAVIAVKIVSGFLGYNSLIKKTVNAVKNYDIDTLVESSSDIYFYSSNEDAAEIYFKAVTGNILDTIEENVGHSYKFKYEIDEDYVVSDRKYDSIITSIEQQYSDFDADAISKIAIAEIKVTATQDKKDKVIRFDIYMTKEDGAWKLYKIDF